MVRKASAKKTLKLPFVQGTWGWVNQSTLNWKDTQTNKWMGTIHPFFFFDTSHLLSLPKEEEGQGPHCFLVKLEARHWASPRRSKDAWSLGWVLTQAGIQQQAGSTKPFFPPVSTLCRLSALENKVLLSPLFPCAYLKRSPTIKSADKAIHRAALAKKMF